MSDTKRVPRERAINEGGQDAVPGGRDNPSPVPPSPGGLRERLSKVDWRSLIEKHGDPPSCPHGIMAGPCAECMKINEGGQDAVAQQPHGVSHATAAAEGEQAPQGYVAGSSPVGTSVPPSPDAPQEHCRDCCCARSWSALGIVSYTGKSIPEHISDLRARAEAAEMERDSYESAATKALTERDALRAKVEELRALLRDCRAAIAPPSVVFRAGFPMPAHLAITHERAQLIGCIDAAIDAARGKE